MPRKQVDTNTNGPFHITARAINKEWFSISMDDVWNTFENHLFFLKNAFDFEIHAFVLMNNHYHLLVSTPKINISDGMAYFQREVSRELNRKGNRINRTFAGRYFKCNLKKYHYFLNCYKYVYQNPVRAGLVAKCEHYPFSSLHGLLGFSQQNIPMSEDDLLFNGSVSNHLNWLNTPPDDGDLESMRNALKKGVLKFRKDPITRKDNRLESKLL